MVIKWRKNTVKVNHCKIKLEQNILKADYFKGWYVIATPTKMYFIGEEDFVLTLSIFNVVFTDKFIYFHSREDRNVYKLGHPLDVEMFLFYSPHYILTNLIVHNHHSKFEDSTFILSFDNLYIIKKIKSYFLHFYKIDGAIKHVITECPFDQFIKVHEKTTEKDFGDIKETTEFINKINSSLEDRLNTFKVEDGLNIHINGDYLIALFNDTACFIDFTHFTERDLRVINQITPNTFVLEQLINVVRPIKVRLGPDNKLFLLQINNLLFYKDRLLCKIDSSVYRAAFKSKTYQQNYYKPFWKKFDTVTRKILTHVDKDSVLKCIVDCIESNNNKQIPEFDYFKLEKINRVLLMNLAQSKTLDDFRKQHTNFIEFNNLQIIGDINLLYKTKNYYVKTKDYSELLNINYKRIFKCDTSLVKEIPFKMIKNLAYQIIFLEENKKAINKNKATAKSWSQCAKFFYQTLKDLRMDEVNLLFNEKPIKFNLENDVETINEKAYVLRLACNVGKSLAFFDSVSKKTILDNSRLVFPMWKNLGITNIEIKEKNWKNWPSFNYTCCEFLSIHNLQKLFAGFVEEKVKTFTKTSDDSEQELAGMLYAFGIRNLSDSVSFDVVKSLISDTVPLLSMILIINYGISQKGNYNQELYEHFLVDQHTDTHPLIKIGLIVAIGYSFINSKNANIINLLSTEANKTGPIVSETYNKNNVLYYDQIYSLTMGFMLAYVARSANLGFSKYIKLDNKLVELLVNGLVFYKTNSTKHFKHLKRHDNDPLEELFYSEFFMHQDKNGLTISDLLKMVEERKDLQTSTIYRLAGTVFGIGASVLMEKYTLSNDEYNAMYKLCLVLEERMITDRRWGILFDYCLISLSVIKNSSCDLDLLKIIRRQIKLTEKFMSDETNYVFSVNGIVKEPQTCITYEKIEKYKLCLGLLTQGLSNYKLTNNINTVIDLVITFYIQFPICTKDQDYFNIFRFNIFNSIKLNDRPLYRTARLCKDKKNKLYNISTYFNVKFDVLSELDKKFVVDTLSDYYENYHSGDYLINIEDFKEMVIRYK